MRTMATDEHELPRKQTSPAAQQGGKGVPGVRRYVLLLLFIGGLTHTTSCAGYGYGADSRRCAHESQAVAKSPCGHAEAVECRGRCPRGGERDPVRLIEQRGRVGEDRERSSWWRQRARRRRTLAACEA